MPRFSLLSSTVVSLALIVSGCGGKEQNPNLASVLLEQLLVKPLPSATEKALAREDAERVLGELKAGADFSEAVRKYSSHPSAAHGGELTITEGWMEPAFDKAAQALGDSSLSGVIDSPVAFYIAYRIQGEYLQARTSHILLSFEKGLEGTAKQRDSEEKHKKAWELYQRLKSGESFYDLAREFSGDPGSAQNGGDIGWHGRNSLARPYEEAAFSQAEGQISEPVETPYGWHIIRTVKKKDLSLKLKIIEFKPKASAEDRSRAKKALEEARKLALGGASLQRLAEQFADSPEGIFSAGEKFEVRNNLLVPELAGEIRKMGIGDVSNILENENGYYIVRLLEKS